MTYEISPLVIMLLLTALVAVGIAIFSWQRRDLGDWPRPFTATSLLAGFWAFAYALEIAATNDKTIIFWAKAEYIGIAMVPVAWFVFSMQYAGRGQRLNGWRRFPLIILPLITITLIFTNEYHHLIWQTVGIDSFSTVDATRGPWFWIHSAYSYVLILLGTLVLLFAIIRFPKPYRFQNFALVLGVLIPWIFNAAFVFGFVAFDLSPVSFTVSALILALAIFRFQLFNVIPIARRVAVEFMKDGLIVLDLENRIIDLNPSAAEVLIELSCPSKISGNGTTELVGHDIGEFLQNRPDLVHKFRDVDETTADITLDLNQQTKYFEMHISPLLNNRNKMYGRMMVFYDVTRRKEAEFALSLARDEALAASQFKTELLARVSHELRTPLNVILGYSEMLQEGIFGPINSDQELSTQKIIDSTEFLTRQVNELLDLSRLEAGLLKLENAPFDPTAIIKHVQSHMRVLAQAKSLDIEVDIEPCLPEKIMGDSVRLEQILLNLVGNAIKFSDDGVITVRLYCPDPDFWAIDVSDVGMGIPPEMHELIFEPFRRVDGSLTRIHAGTGLGLAIVKQLSELMGGKIFLESKVNEGSRFTVLLPFLPVTEEIDE